MANSPPDKEPPLSLRLRTISRADRALNTGLLLGAAAGAVGRWPFGRVAHAMHRSSVGRPPKFDVSP